MGQLNLTAETILHMVCRTMPLVYREEILGKNVWVMASDSYGTNFDRRTWVFVVGDNLAVGSIERHNGGLKMICSSSGNQSHTYFFTEDGIRTSCRSLRKEILSTLQKKVNEDYGSATEEDV